VVTKNGVVGVGGSKNVKKAQKKQLEHQRKENMKQKVELIKQKELAKNGLTKNGVQSNGNVTLLKPHLITNNKRALET